MPHRSIEQLREAEAKLVERLAAVRAEIKARETREVSRMATAYAKVIKAAAKEGGTMPTPEDLAAMLSAAPAKPARRRRAAKAAPRRGRKAAAA